MNESEKLVVDKKANLLNDKFQVVFIIDNGETRSEHLLSDNEHI